MNAMAISVRKAFAGKKDSPENQPPTDVFLSPVMSKIETLKDVPLIVVVTPSSTNTITIERVGGKVQMGHMVTGVMGPESMVYYQSKQLCGLCVGLKGVYDFETLMEYGINRPNKDGKIVVESERFTEPYEDGQKGVPGFPGMKNAGKGKAYFPALHAVVTLLILAVIVGNIGMALARAGK